MSTCYSRVSGQEERSLKAFVGTVKLISLFFKLNVLIILVTALPVH